LDLHSFPTRRSSDLSGSETNSQAVPDDSAATVDTGITSGGNVFFDVYPVGLLVMSVVGGVRNSDRCRFATNSSRSDDRFGRAPIDLHMWHAVGLVEPRNLRRPKHNGNSRPVSFLSFGRHGYDRRAMPFDRT